ncbi:MAG: hypothetical protein JXR13_15030 [Thalassovita sp.]
MIDFSVYDRETGRILRSGQSQDTALEHQLLGDNEALIVGALNSETDYVNLGRSMARPSLPGVTVTGCGFVFDAMPPAGTEIKIVSRFISETVPVSQQSISLSVPEEAHVEIIAPWPTRSTSVQLVAAPYTGPDGAQNIAPDIDRMREYFQQAVASRADELADAMLGNPDDHTRERWKLKRSIRDRYAADTNSAADSAAMSEAVRYSGLTVQQELERVGAKIAFEDWVVMRADGIRQEAERRLNDAIDAAQTLIAIAWAEAESAAAVVEAQSRLSLASTVPAEAI